MYISNLKLWNFRKYGSLKAIDLKKPSLEVPFNRGMNILIGDNDAGKSTIIDAIKLVLKTHAYEWIKVEETDFYHDGENKNDTLRIEIEFSGITDDEAANFIEWSGWSEEKVINQGEEKVVIRPKLILIYQVKFKNNRILASDVRAGMDGYGNILTSEAKEHLKCTYLKALRDADNELNAKKNSRLSQILKEHKEFKTKLGSSNKHEFEELFEDTRKIIEAKFRDKSTGYNLNIKEVIDGFIKSFIEKDSESVFDLGLTHINNILEKLSLGLVDKRNVGLGTMNRLFMAAELLHLKTENSNGLKLCMVEELEAHLHPQAQLKIITRLKEEKDIQYILTTHSPNITSQADLKDIIICKDYKVFPMGENYTMLDNKNYNYLKRFLDVTKSNLFFSKGNIIVEGWSEEIILPVLAKRIGYDLTKKEISIINVGSIAYLHFAKIFLRKDKSKMNLPIAIVTDLDNKPNEKGIFKELSEEIGKEQTRIGNLQDTQRYFKEYGIKMMLAKEWTLEWCLYKSCLSNIFKQAVSNIHSGTDEFKLEEDKGFKDTFEEKFIAKLSKKSGTSALDKVAIAGEFVSLLENDKSVNISVLSKDIYLTYLIDAIKFVCNDQN